MFDVAQPVLIVHHPFTKTEHDTVISREDVYYIARQAFHGIYVHPLGMILQDSHGSP